MGEKRRSNTRIHEQERKESREWELWTRHEAVTEIKTSKGGNKDENIKVGGEAMSKR